MFVLQAVEQEQLFTVVKLQINIIYYKAVVIIKSIINSVKYWKFVVF